MSVVAYKDGVLAADSKAYGGSWCASPGTKAKIHRLDDGTRFGVTSSVIGIPDRLVAWIKDGAVPEKWGTGEVDARILMVKPNGDVFLASNSLYFSGPLTCDCYAVGSGCDYALGAMLFGASAEDAVRVAMKLDPHCGGDVAVLR